MTYGIPYTVRGWGDEVVTTVSIGGDPPPGYTTVIRGTEPGPVILVPTAALTPVDTTPAEPEPGAYDLNGVMCVRWTGDDSERHWALVDDGAVGGFGWWDWPTAWAEFGGPGVTIRRLIPEPAPVQLPWRAVSAYGSTLLVDGPDAEGEIEVDFGQSTGVQLTAEHAEEMAAALLTAARAAREATR